jgi:hypothetical protein
MFHPKERVDLSFITHTHTPSPQQLTSLTTPVPFSHRRWCHSSEKKKNPQKKKHTSLSSLYILCLLCSSHALDKPLRLGWWTMDERRWWAHRTPPAYLYLYLVDFILFHGLPRCFHKYMIWLVYNPWIVSHVDRLDIDSTDSREWPKLDWAHFFLFIFERCLRYPACYSFCPFPNSIPCAKLRLNSITLTGHWQHFSFHFFCLCYFIFFFSFVNFHFVCQCLLVDLHFSLVTKERK